MIFSSIPRTGLVALTLLSMAGCSTIASGPRAVLGYAAPGLVGDPRYAAFEDHGRTIPAIPAAHLTDENVRQLVDFTGPEAPGTIVVDPAAHFLYLVEENGKAMRYRVGVGKAGFAFAGNATIARKAEWPGWTPTANMLKREPDRFGPYAGGLEGGLGNPLGARALYLYRGGRDTYYRIHGTNEPATIGRSVSSGCIRMFNQDVIDLETRVPVGAKVVVRSTSAPVA
ncbi:L,D-transpeptidase [Aurantimonas sp. HBX-1]|uniref:L,D-transpeptidase n=1 Tax=Aurantimonas sp. HBX-1 TaxID=2906072 RepID=UPI001F2FFB1D|nr:L,D-transpeptidase [Aurantimonas sp. HBX-1]UIJ73938.1 L,D-transpeptidase [Aurantimonas sp. HBX-1]